MNTTTILFLCFIFACLGASVGALIQRAMDRRTPSPTPPSTNTLAEKGDMEIFRAWRTSDNQVWLEMDGARLDNKDALQPEQHQRLLRTVLDLRPWLEAGRPSYSTAIPEPAPTQQTVYPSTPVLSDKPQNKAAEKVEPDAALKSIVEQIDEVLQAKLITSPLKDRGIKLEEGPGGTVIVKDGVNKYEGVNAIPDLEIKALIREAVTEWEKGSK